MIYHGHIENGHVVLDEPVALPDGAQVSVHIQEDPKQADQESRVRTCFGSIASGDARSADWLAHGPDRTLTSDAHVAQWLEQDSHKVTIVGSNPTVGTVPTQFHWPSVYAASRTTRLSSTG